MKNQVGKNQRCFPLSPRCPRCKGEMGVWTSTYGARETSAVCKAPECGAYRTDFIVQERQGKWVIQE